MSSDVFISYSNRDQSIAKAICTHLESEKVSCWIAPRDIQPGVPYAAEIMRGLESCKVVVLVFSKSANTSSAVKRELERASSKDKPIVTFRIENALPGSEVEYFIGGTQWLDAYPGTVGAHLGRLAAAIKNIIEDSSLAVDRERRGNQIRLNR